MFLFFTYFGLVWLVLFGWFVGWLFGFVLFSFVSSSKEHGLHVSLGIACIQR